MELRAATLHQKSHMRLASRRLPTPDLRRSWFRRTQNHPLIKGRGGLVVRSLLPFWRVPGSKPVSTENPSGMRVWCTLNLALELRYSYYVYPRVTDLRLDYMEGQSYTVFLHAKLVYGLPMAWYRSLVRCVPSQVSYLSPDSSSKLRSPSQNCLRVKLISLIANSFCFRMLFMKVQLSENTA
ncbi:hypothetical protein AVEN_144605-1 [Araneus ventricosus]|uniref:Uncharacterized protein n=1 Tax=Araneus ventricosus TaxID=182803 RepID=A0A4Y2BZ33_ARAVE|nr:hypothetical protein AVEN_144605-1 [Araneus ventricosus]